MRALLAGFVLLTLWAGGPVAAADAPLLLRYPAISRTEIVFNYAGDLWIVSREGGEARRLTAGAGNETVPHFSPDGATVAFTGEYQGNRDVYVVPAAGGEPRRLTYHPAEEVVRGWTPDGREVVFSSTANSHTHAVSLLYTVPLGGGLPSKLPLPSGEEASFSPDGRHLAYVPHLQWQAAWKRYRGGQTTPIWIADLKDSSVVQVPRNGSNDCSPMWVGGMVYFLSDRDGPAGLYGYDVRSGQVSKLLASDGLDFKTAQATQDAIIIEQFGQLTLYDLASHRAHPVPVRISGDLAEVRPRYVKVEPAAVQSFGISPGGARAVFEAWGEIFTVPAGKGDIRNLTRSPAVAERAPAWSQDGRWIAYFSDESGEYQLTIRDQEGLLPPRRISLGDAPTFYYEPIWSPDGRKIAYSDKHLGLWYVDVQTGARVRVDSDYYEAFVPPSFTPHWAPDGQWLTYSKQLPSGLHAVFVYSLQRSRSWAVTDGMSDARSPVFDRSGRYLYFTASTDAGPAVQPLDMSSTARPVSSNVYLAVLGRDDPSPLAPESDEEGAARTGAATALRLPVRIDPEDIGQRILALPAPAGNYVRLASGKAGVLFAGEAVQVPKVEADGSVVQTVHRLDLAGRVLVKWAEGVNDFAVSAEGGSVLYRQGPKWLIASADEGPKPGAAPLKLDDWEVYIEPRPMWRQMWTETWRVEREFFYDPHYHGLDLSKVQRRYLPYVTGLASRDALTYLLQDALGELSVGHVFVRGGDRPEVRKVKVGLLGADYVLDRDRYRFARVYGGESWDPALRAPLTGPGVNVQAGEYLLAVNSRELHASDSVYAFFEGLAGKQVVLRVGRDPAGGDAREVTVVPVEDEEGLRQRAWIETNRRTVDQATGGRVAYVYVPDTGHGGFTSFNRYFFSQAGKEAVIIDERYNEGGRLADYIIDYLRRPILSRVTGRDGHDWSTPSGAIYGPKVMIVNEMAGSGGDALPWYFRKAGLGPLVGKRTWGGLVGIGGYPRLIDGGEVTAPRAAIYGLAGQWEVENHGVEPDIDVDLDPQLYRNGHDSQLERAIQAVLQQLKEHPTPVYVRPPYPDYHRDDGLGAGASVR
jgi:tricorn protease